MLKNQKGFAHHFLFVFIVIAVIPFVGFNVYKAHSSKLAPVYKANTSQNASQTNPASLWASQLVYDKLPDCQGNQLLTSMPLDEGTTYDMIPLGLVNGTGGHTYPSDHAYFDLHDVQQDGLHNVLSPGNIYVTKIRRISRTVNGVTNSDASIYFMTCKQVAFYFNHVHITAALDKAVPAINDPKTNDCAFAGRQNGKQNSQTNTVDSDCSQLATTLVKLSPGELMGTVLVNQNQAGWDFGAVDARVPDLKLINPGTEGDTSVSNGLSYLKSVCPINYFSPAVQQAVFTKPGFAKRPAASKCGEIAQDKLGSIQGNWYEGSHVSYVSDWAKQLAVIHYNKDPSIGAISVGGTLGQGGVLGFKINDSGTINIEPSLTKVGPLYCFEDTTGGSPVSNPSYATGYKILLQLTDSKTMKAEYKTGSCSGSESFSQPSTYYR